MLSFQYLASTAVFALFILSVVARAIMLRRQGVRAMLFGETDKKDFLLPPFVLLVVYVIAANAFGWPVWDVVVFRFWETDIPGWVGLALCLCALLLFWYTLLSFGKSFRVGIDEHNPAELVTSGAFAFSRNPIYVCFLMFLSGLFLLHCNIVVAIALLAFAGVIHRQILREEAFLSFHYGKNFEEYRKKVRRYL